MAAWTAMVVDSGGGSAEDILVNSTSPQGELSVNRGLLSTASMQTFVNSRLE